MTNSTCTQTRPTQLFVSHESTASNASQLLRPASLVQLIPVSPDAEINSQALAAELRSLGHKVAITRPLPAGTDLSSASSIARV
jgi:hypothetical protein